MKKKKKERRKQELEFAEGFQRIKNNNNNFLFRMKKIKINNVKISYHKPANSASYENSVRASFKTVTNIAFKFE